MIFLSVSVVLLSYSCFNYGTSSNRPSIEVLSSHFWQKDVEQFYLRYIADFNYHSESVISYSSKGKRIDNFSFSTNEVEQLFDLKLIEDSIHFTYNCAYARDGEILLEGIHRLSPDSLLLLKYQDNLFFKVNTETGLFDTLTPKASNELAFICHQGFGILRNPLGGYIVMAPPKSTDFLNEPMIAILDDEHHDLKVKKRIIELPEVYENRQFGLGYFSNATIIDDSLIVNFTLDSNFYVYDLGTDSLSQLPTELSFAVDKEKESSAIDFESFMTHVKCLVYHEKRKELIRVIVDKRNEQEPIAIFECYDKQLTKKGEVTISLSNYWYKPIPFEDHYVLLKNKDFPDGDTLFYDEVEFNY